MARINPLRPLYAHRWDRNTILKMTLVLVAIVIAAGSLAVSRALIRDLKQEEQGRMEIWAEAMRSLIHADENTDLGLVLKVINSNHTIPLILLDEQGKIVEHRNVDLPTHGDTLAILQADAARMTADGRVMHIALSPSAGGTFSLCYDESLMLRRLSAFPYVQLGVVALFILIALFALFTSMRSEQNKVWVGLSRETAHQLGTPISSLMAWTEILRESYPEETIVDDLGCDVERLQLIAERFSKMGSAPEYTLQNLVTVTNHALHYMQRRTSGRVQIRLQAPEFPIMVRLNAPLLEWVIENLCKNAIDAMSGIGQITVTLSGGAKEALIEVSDTGKGIPKSQFKRVFRPGFTTKKRGWGLGLSLARRIVEEYHGGSITIKSSEVGVGTTFAIRLPYAG